MKTCTQMLRRPTGLLATLLIWGFVTASLLAGDAPPDVPAAPMDQVASPRGTMQTFLKALDAAKSESSLKRMLSEHVGEAVQCLDLSKIDALARQERAATLAWMLLDILDRTWRVEYADIPDTADGPTYRRSLERDGKSYGELVLSRQPNGRWLFDADFVAKLPALHAAVVGLPLLEDLTGAGSNDPGLWLMSKIPPALRARSFVLLDWQWLGLAILLLVSAAADGLARLFFRLLVKAWLRKQAYERVAEAVLRAQVPMGWLALAGTWWLGLYLLLLPLALHGFLAALARLGMAVAGVWLAYRLVDVLCGYWIPQHWNKDERLGKLIVPMVSKLLKLVVTFLAVLFVAENLGINVNTLLATVGISGVAIALASKDTVENVFGSFTVLIDQPFKIGDAVKIGDVEGIVEKVGFRSTRVRTFYNSLVTIPNSKLVGAIVDNYGARDRRRVQFSLLLRYSVTPEQAEALMEGLRELIRKHPYTSKDYFHVYLNNLAPGGMEVMVYAYVQTPNWGTELRERERLLQDGLRLARKLGVSMAYPNWDADPAAAATAAQAAPKMPQHMEEARELGRKLGAELAAESFSKDGKVPAPVTYGQTEQEGFLSARA